MSHRRLAAVLWGALFGWSCVILWLSSLTPDELPDAAFAFWDKLNHFAAYAVGGWLAGAAVRVSRPRSGVVSGLLLAILLVATFGAADEALQTLTPGRAGGDVEDWAADVLGATAGALLVWPTLPRLLRRRGVSDPGL